MTKASRCALLSALVYPGAGQIKLRRWATGLGFIGLTTVGVVLIVLEVVKRVAAILPQVQREAERGVVDFGRIVELAVESGTVGSSLSENAGLFLIVFCWGISIIHAYFLGKRADETESPGEEDPDAPDAPSPVL